MCQVEWPCRERSTTQHALSQWASRLDYLKHFHSSSDVPCCSIAFCGSSLTILRHSLDYTYFFICTHLLHAFLGFSFHFLFFDSTPLLHETHRKFKFLILRAAANGVHRNLIPISGNISGIFLANLGTGMKNGPICLSASLSPMAISRILSMYS